MKNIHKIDELFHEKLKEASVHERNSGSTWEKINAGLDKQGQRSILSGKSGLVTMVSSSFLLLIVTVIMIFRTPNQESSILIENLSLSKLNTTITNHSTSSQPNTITSGNSISSQINSEPTTNSPTSQLNTSNSSNSTRLSFNQISHNYPASTLLANNLVQTSSHKQTGPGLSQYHWNFSSITGIHFTDAALENQAPSQFSETEFISSSISQLTFAIPYLDCSVESKPLESWSYNFESKGFKPKRHWIWDVSVFAGASKTDSRYSSLNSENLSLANARTLSIEEISDRTVGIRLSTQYWRFLLETGVSYTELKQIERYNLTNLQINILWDEVYGTHPVSYADTSWYYQYVNGDTIWIPAIQNYTLQVPDTSLISISDTIQIEEDTSFLNSYSHFEVPFLAGYLLGQGTFEVYFKAGVVAKYYTQYKGFSTLGPWVKDIYALDFEKISRMGFDSFIGAEFRYHPGYGIYFFGDVYYRRSLLNGADSYGFKRNEEKYGIKIGLGYYL